MPELPEVETVRRGLERHVVGRVVTRVEVGRERSVRRTGRAAVVDGLTGTRVTAARRRGKYLVCELDSGDALMVHLRMSGRLLVAPAGAPRPPHTHVVLHLAPRRGAGATHELRFVDPRTFGEVVVFDPAHAEREVPDLAGLGPDPIVDGLDPAGLRRVLGARRGRIKAVLLDQRAIAGIGNIYADEILHRARLRPDRPADRVRGAALARLHAAIVGVLRDAIEDGGSTLEDTQYVDLEGATGGYQLQHRVYGRAGERCVTCGRGRVRTMSVASRTSHWCGVCQR
ncbi:MAG: formamidopyrimidine-DNA glycosylase/DNA-(apurinic or apyrimidinic site) lyase [Actinomycetota bacterium]